MTLTRHEPIRTGLRPSNTLVALEASTDESFMTFLKMAAIPEESICLRKGLNDNVE
ncbi:hypothetical protein AB0J83_36695 [Actinoplanes sp. NPDC049596]|uniref:hypothetical protein n=1 Tax=unclassified Actinoplanes TaxID=2626549 RepID=UPI00343E1935